MFDRRVLFAFSCILSVPLAHNTTTDLHMIVQRIFYERGFEILACCVSYTGHHKWEARLPVCSQQLLGSFLSLWQHM